VGDEFDDVTILYADIKGFTDYSASVEPRDVVNMLSALFTKFDKMCVKYNIYKVYTIGDCYVALSFIEATARDPGREAVNMVKMALSMIDIIREVRKEVKFDGLDMRIGLHTVSLLEDFSNFSRDLLLVVSLVQILLDMTFGDEMCLLLMQWNQKELRAILMLVRLQRQFWRGLILDCIGLSLIRLLIWRRSV